MTALTLNQEFGIMRLRFKRTLAVSVGLHLLLFAWMIMAHHGVSVDTSIVEITWLEQKPALVREAPPPVIPKIETIPAEVVPEPIVKQSEPELTVKEKLAVNTEHIDRVQQKLKALKPSSVADKALSALPASSTDLLNVDRTTMAPNQRREPPANLNRGSATDQPAVALTRGPTSSHKAANVVVELPIQSSSSAAAARPDAGSTAVRHLGEATLSGLVADRRVLAHTMPVYPAWATNQAVEATVTLYFLVLPNGLVKENVQVQKTAGYQDFDTNAVTAIRQWRFESQTGKNAREQWGTITFRYRLHD